MEIAGFEPAFDAGVLLADNADPVDARRQLSRWVAAGRLYQVRRGLYALAPPFQKVVPHPFLVANRLVHGSYVSCQSALAYYGLIPEYVMLVPMLPRGNAAADALRPLVPLWRTVQRQAVWIDHQIGEYTVGRKVFDGP